MKLRFFLAIVSVCLTLASSADHKSNSCSGCWRSVIDAPAVEQTLGVNIHFTEAQPGEIKMIAEAGFRWVRMDFKWDETERERGVYDFSAYDRQLTSLDQFQIRPLFILDYGNPLYADGGPPRTEAARQAFANWAVAAARHFANRGIVWEIYNEPNLKTFWAPGPNVDEYAALVAAVNRAFRSASVHEKLIGPATSQIDASFIEACLKAGVADRWAAVSVHPYRQTDPETAPIEYARVREMLERYGVGGVRALAIISGEWGYSSAWRGMDEQKQAAMVARTFLTNVANGIPLSIWYDWRDDGVDPKDPEHHFGLVRNQFRTSQPVLEAKPAYLAAKTLSEQLKGFHFVERLAVGSDDDYVLVFAKDSERRIAAWTTGSPRQLRLSDLNGQFSMTKMTGEPAGRFLATDGGLSIETSTAPIYLARIN
jgi:polysaccharide biosynthesis protein PslG